MRPFPTLLLAAACAGTVACAPKLMKLPGAGGPTASDARDVLSDATAVCRGVHTLSAEIAVSGSVNAQRLRGRLLVGVATPASARIEAVAPAGQPIFIFVARDADATLLLPRDQRVLEHGAPDAVLEAVTGISLDGAQLRRVLSGCPQAPDPDSARAPAADWRIVRDGADDIYLHRLNGGASWQTAAMLHRPGDPSGWRAEYRDYQQGLPRIVRLVSGTSGRFDLQLTLSQLDVNTTLSDEVFHIEVPQTADRITIDELRKVGPLARQSVREN
jgi:hypothetical protein